MKCKNHPDQETVAVCRKFNFGFCNDCCEESRTEDLEAISCFCTSPKVHCSFRQSCLIYFNARKKSRIMKEKESQPEQ